jgi:hypothetical protein
MNISYTLCNEFEEFYDDNSKQECDDYITSCNRIREFTVGIGITNQAVSFSPKSAQIFFRLFWTVIQRLYEEEIHNENSLYESADIMSTSQKYLIGSKVRITNEEIKEISGEIYTKCFIMAQAIGFKNPWTFKPRMKFDAADSVQMDYFCKVSARLLCTELVTLLNQRYSRWIDTDIFHLNCPLIVMADLAHTFTPMDTNCSLITDGYYGKKVLQKMIDRSVFDEYNQHRTKRIIQPTGECYFEVCYSASKRYRETIIAVSVSFETIVFGRV